MPASQARAMPEPGIRSSSEGTYGGLEITRSKHSPRTGTVTLPCNTGSCARARER